jgi:hypothetical protein
MLSESGTNPFSDAFMKSLEELFTPFQPDLVPKTGRNKKRIKKSKPAVKKPAGVKLKLKRGQSKK